MKRALGLIAGLILGISITGYSQVFDSPPRDGVYDKIHTREKKPVPYAPLREADVFWVKRVWRVIDFREKQNHPFYYPTEPAQGRTNFMTMLVSALKEGSLLAFDGMDDEFKKPRTWEELEKSMVSKDTLSIEDPDNPGFFKDTVMDRSLDVSKVKKLRIKEEWFIDKQRSVQDVRILGFCPVLDAVDEQGNYKGTQPLFWIYFPDARQVMAKTEVYNAKNDAERRTWDDIFWKRMFFSYVTKESNVYDRGIGEYSSGMDALYEAERVKEEIFKQEHDMWEF